MFQQFLYNKIVNVINDYPAENSIILLDNAGWHNRTYIRWFCDQFNIICLFLPSYFPLLCQTEYIFLGNVILYIFVYFFFLFTICFIYIQQLKVKRNQNHSHHHD